LFYGKIFEQIYESSVCEDWKAMVVFQQLIVLSDQDGIVDMTHESIQRRTNLPIEIIEHGLTELQKPDKRSRSSLSDGRRIVLLDDHRDWGWYIVNYKIYRDKATQAERNEKRKLQMREQRATEKALNKQTCPTSSDSVTDVPHQKRKEQCSTDTEKNRKKVKRFVPPTPEEATEYAKSIGFKLDGNHFVDYYAARGWELGKGRKMKDWKACVRTWKNNGHGNGSQRETKSGAQQWLEEQESQSAGI